MKELLEDLKLLAKIPFGHRAEFICPKCKCLPGRWSSSASTSDPLGPRTRHCNGTVFKFEPRDGGGAELVTERCGFSWTDEPLHHFHVFPQHGGRAESIAAVLTLVAELAPLIDQLGQYMAGDEEDVGKEQYLMACICLEFGKHQDALEAAFKKLREGGYV